MSDPTPSSTAPKNEGDSPRMRHQGPNPGILGIVLTVLFLAGLWPVTTFGGKPYFPGPWQSASAIATFFQARPHAVLLCLFLQFGSAVVIGIFTASIVNQLRFLGVRAAGVNIALFGGFACAFTVMANCFVLWTMVRPGLAQHQALTVALYYLAYAFGGPGFSVTQGLLMAGVSIPTAFLRLLPRWITTLGIILGACGTLSSLNLLFPQALFLIPLTRFPGFLWIIAAGFALPRTITTARANANQRLASAF